METEEAVALTGRFTITLFFNPHEEARGCCCVVFRETEKGDLLWFDLERRLEITHGFWWQILLACAIEIESNRKIGFSFDENSQNSVCSSNQGVLSRSFVVMAAFTRTLTRCLVRGEEASNQHLLPTQNLYWYEHFLLANNNTPRRIF